MRKPTKQNIDQLPPGQLRSVMDSLGYLSAHHEAKPQVRRPVFAVRLSTACRDAKASRLVPVADPLF